MRCWASRCLLPLVASLGLVSAAHAAEKKAGTIAVTDLKGRGVDEVASGALTTEVTNTIAALRVFQVISGEDIKRLLSFEETRQQCTGEADAACLAEIGGALGVEYLVYGEVAKLGDTYSISLALLDTAKASAVNRVNAKVSEGGKLLGEAGTLAKVLMRPLLEARRGFLVLESREAGAKVEVDGRAVGETPLGGRVELTMGPHEVKITKDGFITWLRTIDVLADGVTVEPVSLVPNQEFIEDYESGARTTRLIAWITAGAAAAMLGTGAALRVVDDSRFDDLVTKGYLERRGVCADINPTYNGTDFCPTEAGRQNGVVDTIDSIESTDSIALVSVIGGAVTGVVSAVLFATGAAPGRYSAYSVVTSGTPPPPPPSGDKSSALPAENDGGSGFAVSIGGLGLLGRF